jgi:hypothetical protein
MGAGRSGRGADGLVEPVVDHRGPGGLAQAAAVTAGAIGTGWVHDCISQILDRTLATPWAAIRAPVISSACGEACLIGSSSSSAVWSPASARSTRSRPSRAAKRPANSNCPGSQTSAASRDSPVAARGAR